MQADELCKELYDWYCVMSGRVSVLQGNCQGPIPRALPQPTQTLAPGQCLIVSDRNVLAIHGGTSRKLVSAWIDNLYLFTNWQPIGHSPRVVRHFDEISEHQRVWFTNLVSEGIRANSSGIFLRGSNSQYYVGGAHSCTTTC